MCRAAGRRLCHRTQIDRGCGRQRADSAARSFIVGQSLAANLVIARVAEAQGDLHLALRAVRRRAGRYNMLPTWYLSTFLREEGRLAALTGDTAGAIRAYQHYLALRRILSRRRSRSSG